MYRANVRFYDVDHITAEIELKFETQDEMHMFFEQLDKASVKEYKYNWQLDGANS